MLTCRHWDKFIDEYLSGRLGRIKRFFFRVHLVLCPPCKRYLDEYRRALDAARQQAKLEAGSTAPLPAGLAETLTKCMCRPQDDQSK